MKMSFPNQGTITLIVSNLQVGASCDDAFKPSSIYKWLLPHTIGSNMFKFTPNSPKCVDVKTWHMKISTNHEH